MAPRALAAYIAARMSRLRLGIEGVTRAGVLRHESLNTLCNRLKKPRIIFGIVACGGRAEPLRKAVHILGSAPLRYENHAGPQHPALALHAQISSKLSGFA